MEAGRDCDLVIDTRAELGSNGAGPVSPHSMPLTKKGKKIKAAMKKEYGAKKGEDVFYASANKGRVKGVERSR